MFNFSVVVTHMPQAPLEKLIRDYFPSDRVTTIWSGGGGFSKFEILRRQISKHNHRILKVIIVDEPNTESKNDMVYLFANVINRDDLPFIDIVEVNKAWTTPQVSNFVDLCRRGVWQQYFDFTSCSRDDEYNFKNLTERLIRS
jgi:hypothetical protein